MNDSSDKVRAIGEVGAVNDSSDNVRIMVAVDDVKRQIGQRISLLRSSSKHFV